MRGYRFEPDPFPSRLRVVAAARSDVGLVREGNEDRVLVADAEASRAWESPAAVRVDALPSSFVALVCDGMGGEAGGEIASGAAVDTIAGAMKNAFAQIVAEPPGSARVAEARFARAAIASIEAASRRIKAIAQEMPELARMGTTATLAGLTADSLVVAQVGDSRAYVLRSGRLFQITRDQTMAELLRQNGAGPVDEDGTPIGANVILQAVGASERLEVVVTRTPLADGDVVLLCSDGLHGVIADRAIGEILGANDPEAACDALVARANAEGAPDNVSCIVFRVAGGRLEEPRDAPSIERVSEP